MISALFVRKDSIYKSLGVDCWDIERDARLWPGGNSIIAHPPCRAWGSLSHFAKPREGEKELAILAVKWIREWGGVLEHPLRSKVWKECNLPTPGKIDQFGGYSLSIDQFWWGHRAQKATLLYIVGCSQKELPPLPIRFDCVTHTIASVIKKKSGRRAKQEVTKSEREHTPELFAKWLVEVANKANNSPGS